MEVPDVMSWLIDATAKSEESQRRAEEDLLESDSRLIIVAGSDTTAAALTYTFYHLAKDPSQVETLRKEIKPFQGSDGEFNVKDLQSADHLNGIINEALRLHPPVPSGTLRVTPPEGITVRGTFIPGDTTVLSPPWTVGRLESCFERASEFIPERWYSKPEMVKNKAAFAPFSLGDFVPRCLH
jgi:cytochrome P450